MEKKKDFIDWMQDNPNKAILIVFALVTLFVLWRVDFGKNRNDYGPALKGSQYDSYLEESCPDCNQF